MRETSLKIKKYASNVNVINNSDLNTRVLNSILWAFGFLAVSYILILGNTIFNIVERKTLEANARDLSTEVNDLELNYLSLSKNVNTELANSMGFNETKNKQFSTRKSLGSISFVNDES